MRFGWSDRRTLTMPEPLSHTSADTSPSSAILRDCEGRKGRGIVGGGSSAATGHPPPNTRKRVI